MLSKGPTEPRLPEDSPPDSEDELTIGKNYFVPVFRIRIHLISIRIQHFRLNTDPDPGFS